MEEMIRPGKHEARIKSYGVDKIQNEKNKGKPIVRIDFETVEGGHKAAWGGTLLENTKSFTLEALYHCGLISVHDVPKIPLGPKGGALDMGLVVEIDVYIEEYTNDKGIAKKYAKVKYIDPLGGKVFANAMDEQDFAFHVTSLGLQGAFLEIAQKYGISGTESRKEAKPVVDEDDIPF